MPEGLESLQRETASCRASCFMCKYATETRVVEYSNFVIKEAHRATPLELATQICADLQRDGVDSVNEAGVARHIAEHMTHPAVKVATLIRELDSTRRTVHRSILSTDPESGQTGVDVNNVNTYVRIVGAMQQLYKLGDPSKLTFGQCADAETLSTKKPP